jgi:hypothetical protein
MKKEYGENIRMLSGANMSVKLHEAESVLETNSSPANKKCPYILWTPNVNYRSWIDGRTSA